MDGKYLFAGVGAATLFGLAVYGLLGKPVQHAHAPYLQPGPVRAVIGWTYTEKADPMSDNKLKVACVASLNEIQQDFPYHDTGAQLCVSGTSAWPDIWIALDSKGQILCDNICLTEVRFDKSQSIATQAHGPSDHSTDVLFLMSDSSDKALTSRLMSSRVMLVQLKLYQNGTQVLFFPTAGLKWPA